MLTILTPIIVIVVLILFIVIFTLRGKSRRLNQKNNKNISKLKAGKANYEFELSKSYNEFLLIKARELLINNNFRVIDNVEDGVIAYFGKNEDVVLHGIYNADPLKLPFRATISCSHTNKAFVKFTDDYGFIILNASQKQKFNDAYLPIFKYYENLLKTNIDVS